MDACDKCRMTEVISDLVADNESMDPVIIESLRESEIVFLKFSNQNLNIIFLQHLKERFENHVWGKETR